jgi:hypothetical protein
MRILLGSDIVIPFASESQQLEDIHLIFDWVRRLKDTICVDFATLAAVSHFVDVTVLTKKYNIKRLNKMHRRSFIAKIFEQKFCDSYRLPNLSSQEPTNINLILAQLSYLENNDVDLLISDNLVLHHIASLMNFSDRVYSTENFIEKCTIENSNIDPYKGILVERVKFGTLNINDPFFDSFKNDYPEYIEWFNSKANDDVYVANDNGKLKALLKLKIESKFEEFSDIYPTLEDEKTLKISSLKISLNGSKIFERFIRLIYSVAIANNIKQVYVTFFNNSELKHRLFRRLSAWGFFEYGTKNEEEIVMLKRMTYYKQQDYKFNYPFFSFESNAIMIEVPSIFASELRHENDIDTLDISPSKNAISKVYITKNSNPKIEKGSILIFTTGKDKEVLGLGIVERTYTNFLNENQFLRIVRKRSIIRTSVLDMFWHNAQQNDITAIELLYVSRTAGDAVLQTNYKRLCNMISIGDLNDILNFEEFYNLIKGTEYERNFAIN